MAGGGLDSLPGMPFLSHKLRERLARRAPGTPLRVEPEELPAFRDTTDRAAYTVYAGSQPVGRLTVRDVHGQTVRVFLCVVPHTASLPPDTFDEGEFSTAAHPLLDAFRIAFEYARLWLFRAAGRPRLLLRLAPWRDLDELRRRRRYSCLNLIGHGALAFDRDATIRHDVCALDGQPFVVLPWEGDLVISAEAEEIAVDIGGYCPLCRRALCARHLHLKEVPHPALAQQDVPPGVHAWRLACRKDNAIVRGSSTAPVDIRDKIDDIVAAIMKASRK
jgi:hypothetical protein